MKKVGMAGLMALATLGATPAWALGTSGSVVLSGLNFTLVDLDENDGVAASMTWLSSSAAAFVTSNYETTFSFNSDGTWQTAFSQYGEAAAEDYSAFGTPLNAAFGNSQASVLGNGLGANFQIASRGSFDSTSAFTYAEFQLSANTELVVKGTLDLAISGPSAYTFELPNGTPGDFYTLHSEASAYASVSLLDVATYGEYAGHFMSLYDANYTPSNDISLQADGYAQATGPSDFELRLTNAGGSDLIAGFSAVAVASGQQIVSAAEPIPEASSYAFMLLGMGLVGMLARRRQG